MIFGVAKSIISLVTIKRVTRLKLEFTDAQFVVNLDITKPLMKELKLRINDGVEWIQLIVYEKFISTMGYLHNL